MIPNLADGVGSGSRRSRSAQHSEPGARRLFGLTGFDSTGKPANARGTARAFPCGVSPHRLHSQTVHSPCSIDRSAGNPAAPPEYRARMPLRSKHSPYRSLLNKVARLLLTSTAVLIDRAAP